MAQFVYLSITHIIKCAYTDKYKLLMLTFTIITISILINLLPAFLVILSDSRSATHRYFFALILAFVGFGLINYISLNPLLLDQITWIRIDLFSAVYLFLFLYLTFSAFPERALPPLSRPAKLFVGFSIIVSLLTLSPLVFSHLEITPQRIQPVAAPGMALFVAQQLLAIVMTAHLCAKKYASSDRKQKKQLKTVITGAAVAIFTIIFFNLVAVQVFHTNAFVPFSSVGVIGFTLSFSFALIRYRFLNFRVLVARSLAYVFLFSTMVAVYALTIFVLTGRLFGAESLFSQRILPILVAVVLALTAQPLKRFFDHVTNRIFYRDAYETEVFLDRFNKVVVSTIELEKLLVSSSRIITENLKAEFCDFSIKKTTSTSYRFIGRRRHTISAERLTQLDIFSREIATPTVVAELLPHHQLRFREFLRDENIDVVATLRSHTRHNHKDHQGVGYILLGPKKSGNPYNSQDLRILEIIANELVIAIQNALRFEEIEQFNVTLQERIAEATRELRVKNKKLHELDKAKDEFISMASHQLRTPLTTVKGYLSMILDGDTGKVSASQRKILDSAYFSSQRMVSLISDMLNVSRMNTGKFVIEPTKVNLLDIVTSEVAQLQRVAESHGITLKATLPKTFPAVMLDESKTRQVMMNFIDNAIYYTPQGGTVQVQLESKGHSIEFRVTDNGIGVSEAEKARLFTKFFRAENARQERPDGTGLGLFMAKKVITAQGGSIIFDSRLGKGSTFGFRFALSVVSP